MDSSSTSESDDRSSNLIATIAATEAAIRIASDIIDSTLAHADDRGDILNLEVEHPHLTSGMRARTISFKLRCLF